MTPTTESSPNAFESGKPDTPARSEVEAAIEALRHRGGVFVEAVRATRMAMALADPNLPGNPIVFANESFVKLSGYTLEEALGQQPFFMNGPDTHPDDEAELRRALEEDRDGNLETSQYRKDGSRFVANVLLSAFKDEAGRTLFHFLSWQDVTRRTDAEEEVATLQEAQARLRESEERYRTLFETMGQGYALVELVRDASGKAVDQLYVELNPAIERLLGISAAQAVGNLASDIFPTLEPWWTETFDRVVRTRTPTRVEHALAPLGRWFEVYAYPAGGDRFITLYEDISERKQVEATLREGEERQAFLLRLSDALRAEPSPEAIAKRALEMLFAHMRLDRCYVGIYRLAEDIGEFPHQVHDDRLPPLPAQIRLSDFPVSLRVARDGTLVVDDVMKMGSLSDADRASFGALGLRAAIAATLHKGESNPLWAIVAASTNARNWTQGEVSLVEEVTERTWAAMERARAEAALRTSEERLRTLFDSIDEGYLEMDVIMSPEGRALDWRYVFLNPAFERLSGLPDMTGKLASEFLPNLEPEWAERFAQVVTTGEAARFDYPAAQLDRWFEVYVVRPGGPGTTRLVMVYNNIIDRKRAEQALRENEARQAFLLKLSDALRAEPNADAVADRALQMLCEQLQLDRCYLATYRLEDDRAEITHQTGSDRVPPMPDIIRLSDFPEALRVTFDRTLVIEDVPSEWRLSDVDKQNMLKLGFGALLAPTLRKGPDRPLWVIVAVSSQPRRWTTGEIALVEDVAERTWSAVERVRAETALRGSEARLAAAFESVPVGVAVINAEGAAVLFNQEYRRFLPTGVIPSRDPARQGRWRAWNAEGQLLDPQDFPGARALRGETVVPGQEMLFTNDDGRECWTSVSTAPIRDGTGKVTGAVAVISDIDAAKRVADALRESEQRHRLIVENARDYAIIITDPYDIITEWLPGAEAVFGWTREEAVGRPAGITFTAADQAERVPEREIETAAREGEAADVRWHQRKDGSHVFIEGTTSPLYNEDGSIRGFLKIGQDVSERRSAQEALEASEQRLRTLVTGIPQMVFRSRSTGERTWGSPQWIEYTGVSFEESVGFGWLDGMHPDDRECTIAAWSGVEEHGEYHCEHRIRHAATGEYRWHQTRAAPLRDKDGTIVEWLGTSTDVEDLRRLQQRQELLLAELQHRVRNILAMLRSVAGRTAETAETVEDYWQHLEGRISTMARTQGLLTRGIGSGVDLQNLVLDELLAQSAKANRFSVTGPDVTLPGKAAEVLGLAVHELATNSVKYGALSVEDGRIDIRWALLEGDEKQRLSIIWSEFGVRMSEPPRRQGFGMELITERVPYELQGTGSMDFKDTGLVATIEFPLLDAPSILQTDANLKGIVG